MNPLEYTVWWITQQPISSLVRGVMWVVVAFMLFIGIIGLILQWGIRGEAKRSKRCGHEQSRWIDCPDHSEWCYAQRCIKCGAITFQDCKSKYA